MTYQLLQPHKLSWPLSKLRIVSHYVISLKIHCKVNQIPIFWNTVKNYKKRNMHGLVKIYGYFQSLKLLGFQRPRLSYIYKERIKQLAWPSRKYPVHNLSSILHRLDIDTSRSLILVDMLVSGFKSKLNCSITKFQKFFIVHNAIMQTSTSNLVSIHNPPIQKPKPL